MKNKNLSLDPYIPMIEGIVALMHPFVECAVHDLRSGKIVALYNNISRRKIGDPSPITDLGLPINEFPDVHKPYEKTNWDGKILKCTSITLRDENKKPIGLICFNFDTTIFRDFSGVIDTFLKVREKGENPVELFEQDSRKKTKSIISAYISENNLVKKHLTKNDRKSLIRHLYQAGVFNFKNATTIIAEDLGITRASVYNYLK